jgi:hypothetical protein
MQPREQGDGEAAEANTSGIPSVWIAEERRKARSQVTLPPVGGPKHDALIPHVPLASGPVSTARVIHEALTYA